MTSHINIEEQRTEEAVTEKQRRHEGRGIILIPSIPAIQGIPQQMFLIKFSENIFYDKFHPTHESDIIVELQLMNFQLFC